jgi:hypothetical protein
VLSLSSDVVGSHIPHDEEKKLDLYNKCIVNTGWMLLSVHKRTIRCPLGPWIAIQVGACWARSEKITSGRGG